MPRTCIRPVRSCFLAGSLLGANGQAADGNLNLWGLIKQGGWAMYPLGLCSVVMLFLILHGVRETTRSRFVPDGLVDRLPAAPGQARIRRVSEILAGAVSVLARALSAGLERARPGVPDANKEKVEETVSESP